MIFSADLSVGVIPASAWSSVNFWAFAFRLVASWACLASCTVSFLVALALAASPMTVFSVWLIASQAAVPVAGPVVAWAEPAALLAAPLVAAGVLAAGVLAGTSCLPPPLLLHPATATAATAIAPMASLFLIACSPLRDGSCFRLPTLAGPALCGTKVQRSVHNLGGWVLGLKHGRTG